MMDEYIKKQDALDRLDAAIVRSTEIGGGHEASGLVTAKCQIASMPAEDVFKVTRCENCTYYHPEKGGWCERHDFEFDVGDFCCHGTPRGGTQNE